MAAIYVAGWPRGARSAAAVAEFAPIGTVRTRATGVEDALWLAVKELTIGAGVGLAAGFLGVALLKRLTLPTAGLYPVASLALAGDELLRLRVFRWRYWYAGTRDLVAGGHFAGVGGALGVASHGPVGPAPTGAP